MKHFNYLLILFSVASFFSCSEVETPRDPNVSVVSAYASNQDSSIKLGETAYITATADDDQGVKSIRLDIRPEGNVLGWKYSFVYTDYNYTPLVGFPTEVTLNTEVVVPEYIYTVNTTITVDGNDVNKNPGDAWMVGEEILDERDTTATPEGEYIFAVSVIDVNNTQSEEGYDIAPIEAHMIK